MEHDSKRADEVSEDERLRRYVEAAMEAERCVSYRGEECVSHGRYPWTEHGCSVAVSMSRAAMAVADAEQASIHGSHEAAVAKMFAELADERATARRLREERTAHIGDDSIRSMELKGERKRADVLEHALAESEAEVARQYHEAQQAEAKVARVEALAQRLREQGWVNVYETSEEFAWLIEDALGNPVIADVAEVAGKPSHGWTCDCDECSEPS